MDFIENGLYHLKGGAGWCRSGIVVVRNVGTAEKPDLVAVDTYWGTEPNFGALERNFYSVSSISDRMEFIINLSECRISHREEWEVFEDSDRAYIPKGGGSEKYLVKKTAKPSPGKRMDQLRLQLTRAENAILCEVRQAELCSEAIALLRQEIEQTQTPPKHALDSLITEASCRLDHGGDLAGFIEYLRRLKADG